VEASEEVLFWKAKCRCALRKRACGSEEIRRTDFGPSWRRVGKKAFGVHLDEGSGTQVTRTGKDCVHDLERLAVSPGDRVLPEDLWQSAGRLLLEPD
jgi:hypothetical protein